MNAITDALGREGHPMPPRRNRVALDAQGSLGGQRCTHSNITGLEVKTPSPWVLKKEEEADTSPAARAWCRR